MLKITYSHIANFFEFAFIFFGCFVYLLKNREHGVHQGRTMEQDIQGNGIQISQGFQRAPVKGQQDNVQP